MSNTTMVTFVSHTFGNFAHNLLLSLEKLGIDQDLHICCIHKEVETYFKEKLNHKNTYYYEKHLNHYEHNQLLYGQEGYGELLKYRLEIVHDWLSKGHNVLHVDADIVFCKDPRPYLEEQLTEYDVLIQQALMNYPHNNNGCFGFFYVRSTPNTIEQFSVENFKKINAQYTGRHVWNWDDQKIFNLGVKNKLKTKILPMHLFPVGDYIYRQPSLSPETYIAHFNCIISPAEKIEEMKKYGVWFLGEKK